MVQFPGAHFGGLIAGEFLFIIFSNITCSNNTLQYHHLISLFMDYLLTLHLATEGALCCYFIIQFYQHRGLVLGMVDALFLATNKPFLV
jgi:hypothetical protein